MKIITASALALLIAGCSSNHYISTSDYSNTLSERCVANLSDVTDSGKTQCALNASSKTHMAWRLYQLREDQDLQTCKAKNASSEAVQLCFEQAQKDYYDNYFSRTN